MRRNLPTAVTLAVLAKRDQLVAEIEGLTSELAELDAWLELPPATQNVPHGTFSDEATKVALSTLPEESTQQESVPEESTEQEAEPEEASDPVETAEKFDSEAYTKAAMALPESFTRDELRELLGVDKKAEHALMTAWQRKGWIERLAYARYHKLPGFGGQDRPLSHLPPEALPVRPAPTNGLDKLNARLNDLQKQHDDCADGSLQQEILADKIEELEAEIGRLEELETKA